MRHTPTAEVAKGRWRDILVSLGAPKEATSTKHGPCPMCGGKDRYRFDDKEGRGSWICNVCGAGDGFHLVMHLKGVGFREAARLVEGAVTGGAQVRAAPKPTTPEAKRDVCRRLWRSAAPVTPGDAAGRYLAGRGLAGPWPDSLRFLPAVRIAGDEHPCLLALVMGDDGATLHRTLLRADGSGKADVPKPRLMMPGDAPTNAAVRLSPHVEGQPLGVAEGIETALSAARLHGHPVWAAINTTLMAKWAPPPGVSEVVIYADRDLKFGGQAAAYTLAHRIACDKRLPPARVEMPLEDGEDWNDILRAVAA